MENVDSALEAGIKGAIKIEVKEVKKIGSILRKLSRLSILGNLILSSLLLILFVANPPNCEYLPIAKISLRIDLILVY